jgi:hypothetical protein
MAITITGRVALTGVRLGADTLAPTTTTTTTGGP